jgi:hypothetical protein
MIVLLAILLFKWHIIYTLAIFAFACLWISSLIAGKYQDSTLK